MVRCSLFAVYSLLFVVCCLLWVVCCSLSVFAVRIVCNVSFAVCCSLCGVRWLLFVVRCLTFMLHGCLLAVVLVSWVRCCCSLFGVRRRQTLLFAV